MKTKFIRELPESVRNDILFDVAYALLGSDLTAAQRVDAVITANDSRLCDLEDLIDIKKYAVPETN